MKSIQLTRRIRLQYGPGKPDIESERPYREDDAGNPIYTDDPEKNPTVVDIDENVVRIDVAALLRSGAIREMPKAKATKPKADHDG